MDGLSPPSENNSSSASWRTTRRASGRPASALWPFSRYGTHRLGHDGLRARRSRARRAARGRCGWRGRFGRTPSGPAPADLVDPQHLHRAGSLVQDPLGRSADRVHRGGPGHPGHPAGGGHRRAQPGQAWSPACSPQPGRDPRAGRDRGHRLGERLAAAPPCTGQYQRHLRHTSSIPVRPCGRSRGRVHTYSSTRVETTPHVGQTAAVWAAVAMKLRDSPLRGWPWSRLSGANFRHRVPVERLIRGGRPVEPHVTAHAHTVRPTSNL